ncbi:MAG: ABC transporter substrate-binding protein, partial [Pseudanabaenaceae cyanobacterium]
MSGLSRRKFVSWMGVSAAGSLMLKGCLGNPPEQGAAPTGTSAAPAASGAAKGLETTKIVLGYIPIVEAAPLIIAKEKGFWAKYGLTEAVVAK